jgi:RNA polymerase sigma factor (sigma-70 family)
MTSGVYRGDVYIGSAAIDRRRERRAGPGEAAAKSGRLFEQHSARILAFCVHTLRDRRDAEDAVQTTFLHAHRALGRGVAPEFEYAWLHSIAKNVCRTQLRTAGRRDQVAADVDIDAIPGQSLENDEQEDLREIRSALASLPDRQRRAFVMREWQGLSSDEVATQLGMTAPATYALLTRARRSLARSLTKVQRGPALGLDLGWLGLRLKALFAGGAAKAVAATAVVAAVAVGGVAVERAHSEPDSAQTTRPGGTTATEVVPTREPSVVAREEGAAVVTRPVHGRPVRVERASRSLPATDSTDTVDGPGIVSEPRPDPRAPTENDAPSLPAPPPRRESPSEPTPTETLPELPLPEVDLGTVTELVPELPPLPDVGDPPEVQPPAPTPPLPELPPVLP